MGCVETLGCSHPTIAAASEAAATAIGVRSFSRARRRASLCKNVMVSAPSWREDLLQVARVHSRCDRRRRKKAGQPAAIGGARFAGGPGDIVTAVGSVPWLRVTP